MGDDVHRLGVGRMAEGLHDEVGGEAEAREILELITRHRAGRVLRADRGHRRLAVLAEARGRGSLLAEARPTIFCASVLSRAASRARRRASGRHASDGGRPSDSRARRGEGRDR